MYLSNKEIRTINKEIEQSFGIANFLSKKDRAEKRGNVIVKDKKPIFFYFELRLVPTLNLILGNQELKIKKVTVDMPAIPFMIKGADVMRPGIKHIDEGIEKDEIILIIDEDNEKPIAIGIALFSGKEIQEMDKGKVIRNIHYVGDEVWGTK